MPNHEAMLYTKLPESIVECNLCSRQCKIQEGKTGFCNVRRNTKGVLYTLNYGKACSACVDPIGKKPLAHFHPGALVMSIATIGCNFQCQFCDNWVISQQETISGHDFPPEAVVKSTRDNDCKGISYTYTEPTIFFEYAYDTAQIAHSVGFFNTFVTNGYMTKAAIKLIAPHLDAATVDFKGAADPDFYRKFSSVPSVKPIFESLIEMKRNNIHIEITNLIIPKVGDSIERIKQLATWIHDNLGQDTPFHLLRFHPSYRMTGQTATPRTTLEDAHKTAREVGLNYVYLGNMPGHELENTHCPNCNELVIKRLGYEIVQWNLTKNMHCPTCGHEIPILGELHPTSTAYPLTIF